MSLSPVPSEQPDATCANCGSQLVADQRYCLSCGQPVSPVRLAFLDVLSPPAGTAPAAWPAPATIEAAPGSYVAYAPQQGANAWLRRNSGLLGLIAILGLFLLAGLLVGHWVSQSKTPANTTLKVEGLGALGAAAASGGASTSTPSGSAATSTGSSSSSKSTAAAEAKEKAEGEHETAKEKAPPPKPKKATSQVNKLSKTHGKQHQEEINALGTTPLEP